METPERRETIRKGGDRGGDKYNGIVMQWIGWENG